MTVRRFALAFPLACVVALGALAGAYSNSFENGFHFDDHSVIVRNLYIRSLKNVPAIFRDASTATANPNNAQYRPLSTTTMAFDYWLGGGLHARQFHTTQLELLFAVGLSLFFLYSRLLNLVEAQWWNRYAALVAATLFCVHPTVTETINIIQVRTELLSTLGVIGAFLAYLYVPRSRRVHLYLIPMVVGALAKSQAVIFAPLFCVYVFLFEEELTLADLFILRSWPRVRSVLWKALPSLVVGAVTFRFVEGMNAPTMNYGGGDVLPYFETQLFVWMHYARLFFLPIGLTADTDWSTVPYWYDTRVFAGLVFVGILLRIVWSTSKTPTLRPVAFGVAWFIIALLPASSVFPLAEVANEHRTFFPFMGLTLAVVWGAAWFGRRWFDARPGVRPMAAPTAVGVVLLFVGGNAVGTHQRNEVWRTEETLWRDVTEKSPTNGRGLMNYGLELLAQGNRVEAKKMFDRALVYEPNYATLEINLAIVTDGLGQKDIAKAHFARALQLQPKSPGPHYFFGRWLVEQGQSAKAVPHLRRAIELSPADTSARYLLLDTYAKTGQAGELKSLVADTLGRFPDDAEAKRYLNEKGEIVLISPAPAPAADTAEGLLDTSLELHQVGDFRGSIDAARKALELRPDLAEAHNNIAAAFASLAEWDDAIQAAREALRLKPDFQLARNNLAWAEAQKRKETK